MPGQHLFVVNQQIPGTMTTWPQNRMLPTDGEKGSLAATLLSGKTGNVLKAWRSLWVERVLGNGKGAVARILKDLQMFPRSLAKSQGDAVGLP